MKICREIDIDDLVQILRCEAKRKWDDATEVQKDLVWQLINDIFAINGNIPTESEINDFVWLQCDDIFFPEDEDEED